MELDPLEFSGTERSGFNCEILADLLQNERPDFELTSENFAAAEPWRDPDQAHQRPGPRCCLKGASQEN